MNQEQKDKAELKGYAVVDAAEVVSTHLMEVIKRDAYKILDRQAVQNLLDNFKEEHSAVVEELVPNLVTVGTIQNVLRNLLKENIPIRDLSTILEELADRIPLTKDPELLTEYVRVAVSEAITNLYKNEQNEIHAMTLDARLEEFLLRQTAGGKQPGANLGLSPDAMKELFKQVHDKKQELLLTGSKPLDRKSVV